MALLVLKRVGKCLGWKQTSLPDGQMYEMRSQSASDCWAGYWNVIL
ncbi:MAG: hypothetical protein KA536_03690 [Saprospiraceae bacterium]|nr:hypothetical protein [Saprospiraceae bacterium]